MAQQPVNIGSTANDGTGDLLRDAFTKLNDNDTELYATKAPLASPALTGTPTAPTATPGTNTTQIASTAFVAAAIALAVTGVMKLKGFTDCSANPNYPAAVAGEAYVVTVAGKIGGASGITVEVGDVYVATADNAGGTQAAVGTSWNVLQYNLVGALLAANNLSDISNAATARTNLGLAINTNVQAYHANLAALSGLSLVADKLAYADGAGTLALTDFSAVARQLLDDASFSAMRTTLGLGNMATQAASSVAINGGTATLSSLTVTGDVIRLVTAKTPASASETGSTGQIAWDANYFYICIGTNTWHRFAHATW